MTLEPIEPVALHPGQRATSRRLALWFGAVFLVTWGIAGLYFAVPDIGERVGSPGGEDAYHNWLYYLAVYAPTLCGIGFLLAEGGWRALAGTLAGVLLPRRPLAWAGWLLVAAFALPAGWWLFSLIGQALGVDWMGRTLPATVFITVPVTLTTTLYLLPDPGPVGEEFGWRGYAMPRLLDLMAPVPAGMLLGAIWAIWHIPAFLISASSQAQLPFLIFFLSLTAQGVFICWLYIRTGGNWFLAGFVPHAMINCSANLGGFQSEYWHYALSPILLAALVCLDPAMRRRAG